MDPSNFDPDRLRRLNNSGSSGSPDGSGGWWDRLTSGSRLWSADGSAAREHFPIADPQSARHASRTKADTDASPSSGLTDGEGAGGDASGAASADSAGAGARDAATGAARGKGRSSWVLVGSLRESAQALALAALPGDADVCLAEAEDLLFARDRIACALADRVGRVHGAGQARQHGHASTRSWLRTAAGMSVAGAGRLLTLAVELARLPRVREQFAAGVLSAGVVEAICTATARLSDEHAGLAEPILLELAGKAGPAEVAKAGRYLRAVLDPDGEERDERADYGRRFLRVRPTAGGGLEGEFYLPREAAARLRALLDAYAKPRAEGDDRPLRVRQADAFIALMEQKIVAELLVLVNAESLPTDHPEDANPGSDHPEDPTPGPDHPEATEDAQSAENTQDAENAQGAEDTEDGRDSEDTGVCGDTGSVDGPCRVEDDDIEDAIPTDDADAVDAGITDAAAPARGEGPYRPHAPGTAEAETAAAPAADAEAAADAGAAADTAAGSTDLDLAPAQGDDTTPPRGADPDRAAAQAEADPERAAARPAYGGSTPPHAAPPHAARPHAAHSRAAEWPDPPPEDATAHHTHAGHQSAGDCRRAQGTPEVSDMRCGQLRHELDRRREPGRHEPGFDEPGGDEQGRDQQDAADGQSACACACGGEARCSCTSGTTGTAPGAAPEAAPGAPRPGTPTGTAPGTPPGEPEPGPGTPPSKPLGAAPGRQAGTPSG
ncbi:DUF222 domain-containing protein, partial [Microbispora bryophytorum]|uniref:DUF222 domain-containing protein n=1 Tax=Microbispora bryophytorum TaxID=1460882 RepID=UPI0034086CD6